MLNVHYITAIQLVYTKECVSKLVTDLKRMGHNDANPFLSRMVLGSPLPEHIPIYITLEVQTKEPAYKRDDYHVWIRPLSGQVIIMTEDGPQDIDVVYGILNGSDGIPPATCIDDTKTWL